MKNKIVPVFVVFVTIGFSGCGSATTSVTNGNVVESTEEMAGNSMVCSVKNMQLLLPQVRIAYGSSSKICKV